MILKLNMLCACIQCTRFGSILIIIIEICLFLHIFSEKVERISVYIVLLFILSFHATNIM